MAANKNLLRSFSIDHILSNKPEARIACTIPITPVCQRPVAPPSITTEAELCYKDVQMRCNAAQQYALSAATTQPPLVFNHEQYQQAGFAARGLPPASSMLSTSWKSDLDILYHNMYLETLLQDQRAFSHPWSAFFSSLPFHKRKGGQVRFTNDQTVELEKKFAAQKYLSPSDRKKVAKKLQLSERQVKTWFQNRRAKWRRLRQDSKQPNKSQQSLVQGDKIKEHACNETASSSVLSTRDDDIDTTASMSADDMDDTSSTISDTSEIDVV